MPINKIYVSEHYEARGAIFVYQHNKTISVLQFFIRIFLLLLLILARNNVRPVACKRVTIIFIYVYFFISLSNSV